MSTRAQIRFEEGGDPVAVIYKHSDGYPEGVIADIVEFSAWLTEAPEPRPLRDLEYAAANLVYWYKTRLAAMRRGAEKLGVGICPTDAEHIHGDTEYLYVLDDRGNIKVSYHIGYRDRPRNWDSVAWEYTGPLRRALEVYGRPSYAVAPEAT